MHFKTIDSELCIKIQRNIYELLLISIIALRKISTISIDGKCFFGTRLRFKTIKHLKLNEANRGP